MSFDAGSIDSTLTLDRAPFMASLRLAREAGARFAAQKFNATLGLDSRRVLTDALRANRQARDAVEDPIDMRVGLAGQAAVLSGVRDLRRSIAGDVTNLRIGADGRPARQEADEVERYLRNVTSRISAVPMRLRVQTDLMRADQQLRALQRLRDSITDPIRRVRVEAQVDRAQKRLDAIREVARGVGASDPTIGISLYNFRRVMADLLGLDMTVRRLDGRQVRVGARMDQNLSRALPQMLGDLGQQLARFQTVAAATGAVSVPLLLTKFAAMPAALSVAAGAAGSLATALAPGLAAAVGSVSAAALTGGGAVVGYGLALQRTWAYVGDFTNTMLGQVRAVDDATRTVKTLETSLAALPPGLLSAKQKSDALALAQRNVRFEQEKLATMFGIMTPRLVGLQEEIHNAKLGLLRFGGSIMHTVAPALSQLIATGGQFGPQFSAGANQMAAAMTRTAIAAVKLGGSGPQLGSITTILDGMKRAGAPALSALTNGLYLFLNVFQVTIPTGVRLVAMLAELVGAARRWSASASGQQAISQAWQRMVAVGQQLWTIATNLGRGLWGVISALNASGVGQFLLGQIVKLSGQFSHLMRAGGEGRRGVEEFMRGAKPILQEAGGLALDLVNGFLKLAGAAVKVQMPGGGSAFVEVLKAARDAVGELLPMLEHELQKILPLVPGLIREVSEFAGIFVAATPEIQLFIRGLTGILGAFNSLPDPMQILIARTFAWGSALSILGGPIFTVVGAVAGMIFKWKLLMALTGRSTSIFGAISGALARVGPAFSAVGRFLLPVVGWFTRLGPLLLGLGSRILPMLAVAFGVITGPVGIAIGVITALATAVYLIYRNWGPIRTWFAGLFASLPGPLRQALTIVGNALRLGAATVRAIFTGNWAPAIAAAKTYWSSLPGPVRTALAVVGNVLRTAGQIIRGIFTGNWAPAIAASRSLWNSLPAPVRTATSVVGSVLRLAGGVIRGIFTGNWSTAVNAARGIFERLPGGVQSAIQRVGAFLRAGVAVVRAIFSGNWQAAINMALSIAQRLFPGVSSVIGRVRTVVNGGIAFVRALFNGQWRQALGIAVSVFNTLFPGVSGVVNRVRAYIGAGVSFVRALFNGNWRQALNIAVAVMGSLFPGVMNTVNRVRAYISAGVGFVRALFNGNWRQALGIALAVFGALFPGVRGVLDRIVGAAQGWISRIRGMFSGLNLYQIGVNVIQGFLNGINSLVQRVIDTARRIADSLPNWVKKRLGIASPSRVMRAQGEQAGEGLNQGLASKQAAIVRSAQAVSASLRQTVERGVNALRELKQQMKRTGEVMMEHLVGAVRAAGAVLRSVLQNSVGGAISSLRALNAQAHATGRSMVDGLVAGVTRARGAIERAMTAIAVAAMRAARAQLQVRSPSRVFMNIGLMLGRGLAAGIAGSERLVVRAARSMSEAAAAAMSTSGPGLSLSAGARSLSGPSLAQGVLSGATAGSPGERNFSAEVNMPVTIGTLNDLEEMERVLLEKSAEQVRKIIAELKRRASSTPTQGGA